MTIADNYQTTVIFWLLSAIKTASKHGFSTIHIDELIPDLMFDKKQEEVNFSLRIACQMAEKLEREGLHAVYKALIIVDYGTSKIPEFPILEPRGTSTIAPIALYLVNRNLDKYPKIGTRYSKTIQVYYPSEAPYFVHWYELCERSMADQIEDEDYGCSSVFESYSIEDFKI